MSSKKQSASLNYKSTTHPPHLKSPYGVFFVTKTQARPSQLSFGEFPLTKTTSIAAYDAVAAKASPFLAPVSKPTLPAKVMVNNSR